jgi:hypothetical protein
MLEVKSEIIEKITGGRVGMKSDGAEADIIVIHCVIAGETREFILPYEEGKFLVNILKEV